MELTQQYLKSILHYNKHTGVFTWAVSRTASIKVGDEAGGEHSGGYLQISISLHSISKSYKAHRLAWLYEYGEWPREHLDHISHDRKDNRIENLREANNSQNSRNISKRKTNKSGFNGVHWSKQAKKWCASIAVNCKKINLGYFTDKNEAICARLHANRLYKFHANHGKS